MNFLKSLFLILILSLNAYGYDYKVLKGNNHVIHVVTIDAKNYDIKIVKADNNLYGRKTLQELSKDSSISINGGFFDAKGNPSCTLVINGKIYNLTFDPHSCLVINEDNIASIQTVHISPNITINEMNFSIDAVNTTNEKSIILYTNAWNAKTPDQQERNEIIINDSRISAINTHGANDASKNQYILSLSKEIDISNIKVNDLVNIEFEKLTNNNVSIIRGIPMLIKDGEITNAVLTEESKFYTHHHARTALGIKANGDIILVVAENDYIADIANLSAEEIRKKLNLYNDKINDANMDNFINVIKQYAPESHNLGLSLKELAQKMLDLECLWAINMDGGGSSTLIVNGKVMNATIGDEDEDLGKAVEREISDAIVFNLKK